jgi:hypothetical protein
MKPSKMQERLRITPEQEEVLDNLAHAFSDVYKHGMGAKEIAVILHDIGPAVPNSVYQWQPFAFFALYADDEQFFSKLDVLINDGQDTKREDEISKDQLTRFERCGG